MAIAFRMCPASKFEKLIDEIPHQFFAPTILKSSDAEILHLFGQQWLSIKDISVILKLSSIRVESLLSDAAIKLRFSRHRQINLYQRSGVEMLADKLKIESRKEIAEQLALPL